MEPALDRRSPVDLPGPEGDNSIAREPLWHAYSTGVDQPQAPQWTWDETPPPDTHVMPSALAVADGTRSTLPHGTVHLLDRTPYPAGRVEPQASALAHALVTAFGPLRREPDNPYNDHRCYASARCLFPVQVFLNERERWRLLEPERHALVELADAAPVDRPGTIALTGRYTRIPAAYKWFRGSLVNIELGIVLRALCTGLDLFGLTGTLRLPDVHSPDLLAELGLTPNWEWSLPLTVEVGDRPQRNRTMAARPQAAIAELPSEPAMADLVRANRTQEFTDAPASMPPSVPPSAAQATGASSWAQLLWNRTSGRMPRGLHGMSGRRSQVPAEALSDAVSWLSVPPPGETLGAVYDAVTVTGVVQSVDGHADGVYRAKAGAAALHHEDRTAAAKLEEVYGYGLTPGNGCDIRHASMIWFFSVRPRELVERFGPSAWSAIQYASGWATQGICLAAAAAGLFARPVRAFKEIPTQHILGLEPEEMIVLTVVVGTPRYATGVLLDLRV